MFQHLLFKFILILRRQALSFSMTVDLSFVNLDDVVFYQNDGSENFTKNTIDSNLPASRDVIIADIDGDGDYDAAATSSHADGNDLVWYSNDGSENFTSNVIADDITLTNYLQLADIDGDDFIAGIQILVYVGGILVLVIFGIMLTNKIRSVRISHKSMQQGVGGVVTLWLFIFLIFAMAKAPWALGDAVEPIGTVREIGILLLTDFLLPFEIISLLLLGALIGAAVLSRGDT